MKLPEIVRKYPHELLLCGILVLAAFLNLWNIWNQGNTNYYYAAAVKTMLVNPAAGFFNSFDPAGFITVDKPPVGLWVQAAFAAVLGVSGWVLVLPQALAGIGSVALIYLIVSRPFGKPAGLVAALALALTPIFVAICRNGTMDSQMIFVLLLSVWVVLKAARERSLPWLLVSAALVGIAFNIKLIQAFIVVPAILAVYFLGTRDLALKKRVVHLGLALAVLLVVSFSWTAVVDSVPADQRPYIGGSGDNTMLGLIISYNGLHRLGIGDSGMGPGAGGSMGAGNAADGPGGGRFGGSPEGGPSGSSQGGPGGFPGGMDAAGQGPGGAPPGQDPPGTTGSPGGSMQAFGNGGGMNSGGSPGIFRLFHEGLAGDIAWLLVFALIGVLAWVRKPREFSIRGFEDAGYTGEKGITIIALLLWLVPGLLYFSFTTGFWHDYYIATIAPPIAALVGIGAAGMYREYMNGSRAGWLLVAAVAITGLLQAIFLSYNADFAGPLVLLALFGTLACAGLLAWIQIQRPNRDGGDGAGSCMRNRTRIIAIALAVLFIAPLVWSCTPIMTGNGGTIPTAGPRGSQGGVGDGAGSSGMPGLTGLSRMDNSSFAQDRPVQGMREGFGNRTFPADAMGGLSGSQGYGAGPAMGGGAPGMSSDSNATGQLAAYLLAHRTGETWILAVPSSQSGADLIIRTGQPVMCLGGFAGSDQVLNLTALKEYVSSGKVRYFLAGGNGGGGPGGGSGISSWVTSSCTAIPGSEWGGSNNSLYDCRGAA